jgi:predicted dehydrogenase
MVAGVDPVEEVAAFCEDTFGIPYNTDREVLLARDDLVAVMV